MKSVPSICPTCFGHKTIYFRTHGLPLRGADGRVLTVPCADCHASGVISVPASPFALGLRDYAKALRDLAGTKRKSISDHRSLLERSSEVDAGVIAIEYALIAALVAIVCISARH